MYNHYDHLIFVLMHIRNGHLYTDCLVWCRCANSVNIVEAVINVLMDLIIIVGYTSQSSMVLLVLISVMELTTFIKLAVAQQLCWEEELYYLYITDGYQLGLGMFEGNVCLAMK